MCVHSAGLSSTTGCIATAIEAEENCMIRAHRAHQYGNQSIGTIWIRLQVCRNYHPPLRQSSVMHRHHSPCVVWSDPKNKLSSDFSGRYEITVHNINGQECSLAVYGSFIFFAV